MMKKFVSLKQILSLLKSHLAISFVSGVLGVFMLLPVIVNHIGAMIFTIVFALVYFAAIYSAAANCAKDDKKPYSKLRSTPWKGFVLPVGILAVSAVLFGLYQFAWTFLAIDGTIATATGVICTLLFNFWSVMFTALMGLERGGVHWYGLVVLAVVPFIASGLGYYAGCRGFEIYDKILRFMYEKKK